MADVAKAPAAAKTASKDKTATNTSVVKPERPDEETYKTELAKAEKELKAAEEKLRALKAKIDLARPNNKDSPSGKRQQELRAELATIRTSQQSSKSSRGQVLDKIKRLDEQLKSRIAEQKTARGKTTYKSVDEIDRDIERLQKQVDTGSMKLVDERKALADISQLNRQKKNFAGFDQAQKGIDEVKAQIAELKKSMDDPESKALSDRYTKITTELDAIKAEQDDSFKSLNSLRDERTKVHEDQQKKYAAVKEIKDNYFQSKRAAFEYEREARRIRDEKRRAENDAYHRGKRQETARVKLEEASAPAYGDQIFRAQTILAHFDPASAPKQPVSEVGKFAATAIRKVEDAAFKGTKVLSKKDNDNDSYFVGGGGKKKKGGRAGQANGTASPAAEGKYNLDIGTIEGLGSLGIDPPLSQSDVPAVVEKLKEKIAFWKGDQDRKTKENIAKAQADIDRLEAEATEAAAAASKPSGSTDSARKPAQKNQGINGQASAGAEAEQEKDAVADAAQDLKNAKLEDAIAPEGTA